MHFKLVFPPKFYANTKYVSIFEDRESMIKDYTV